MGTYLHGVGIKLLTDQKNDIIQFLVFRRVEILDSVHYDVNRLLQGEL